MFLHQELLNKSLSTFCPFGNFIGHERAQSHRFHGWGYAQVMAGMGDPRFLQDSLHEGPLCAFLSTGETSTVRRLMMFFGLLVVVVNDGESPSLTSKRSLFNIVLQGASLCFTHSPSLAGCTRNPLPTHRATSGGVNEYCSAQQGGTKRVYPG